MIMVNEIKNNPSDKTKIEKQVSVLVEVFQNLYHANISILFTPLYGKTLYDYQGNQKMISASVIKTFILVAVLEKVKTKELDLHQMIDFRGLKLPEYNGIYTEKVPCASIEELLTFMIILSDNMATNVLIDLLGIEHYNHYFTIEGYLDTKLNRKMGEYDKGIENYTSHHDLILLYQRLFQKQILTPELCDFALQVLKQQRGKSSSQRYIYENLDVYHKLGGLSYIPMSADTGCFIMNDVIYYFGFFIEGGIKEEQRKFIGQLFQIFYQYVKNR